MLVYSGAQTMNKLIGGGLDGGGLTEILSEPSSNGSFRQVLANASQQVLLAESASAMGAMATSLPAIEVMVESVATFNAVVGSKTATDAIAASDIASYLVSNTFSTNDRMMGAQHSVGAYLNRLLLLEQAEGSTGDLTLAGQRTMFAIVWHVAGLVNAAESVEAMEALVTSPTAVALISGSPVANNLIIGSPYFVGYYLDYIRALDGRFISPALRTVNLMAGSGIGSSAAALALIGNPHDVNMSIAGTLAVPAAVADILVCPKATFAVASSAAGAAAVSVNTAASQSFSHNDYGNTLVLGSASVGVYLNTLLKAAGGTSSAALASQTTVAGIAADSSSMAALIGSAVAFTALAGSQEAMTAIFASDAASDAILTSTAAKTIVYSFDAALAGLQANPAQVQRQITARGLAGSVAVSNNTWVPVGTKAILLRRWYVTGADFDAVMYGRDGTGVRMGARSLNANSVGLGSVPGTYTSNGTPAGANDATSNFVAATNGLMRDHWTVAGSTMNVAYLLV